MSAGKALRAKGAKPPEIFYEYCKDILYIALMKLEAPRLQNEQIFARIEIVQRRKDAPVFLNHGAAKIVVTRP
ncbi:hypothetical protein [Novosphingobium sp. P6W]|uniref:hypothetical protein n=1 Tax=Novosphingobium sp. P6W TaxID=1609758 RepID=UPI000A913EF6|nr:hypothetical protein [Novosphingobium sp. P6W]